MKVLSSASFIVCMIIVDHCKLAHNVTISVLSKILMKPQNGRLYVSSPDENER